MFSCRRILLGFAIIGTSTLAFSQTWTQNDPTHRPEPLYSKSQKKHLATVRSVSGVVKDEHDNIVDGALVHLTNLKTKVTTDYFTHKTGYYVFEELSRDEDYTVSAEFHGEKTRVFKLSHFDPQLEITRVLVLGETEEPADQTNTQTVTPKATTAKNNQK